MKASQHRTRRDPARVQSLINDMDANFVALIEDHMRAKFDIEVTTRIGDVGPGLLSITRCDGGDLTPDQEAYFEGFAVGYKAGMTATMLLRHAIRERGLPS